jgi:hypothetical protein
LTKEGLAANVDAGSLEQALYLEDRNQTLCVNAGYVEEGARAFIEKRRPRFAEGAGPPIACSHRAACDSRGTFM